MQSKFQANRDTRFRSQSPSSCPSTDPSSLLCSIPKGRSEFQQFTTPRERMCCANLPQFLAVKINSSHVSKTPPRPQQNRCSLDPSVTCTSYITSAPGRGKMQPRLPPHPPRGVLAQHNPRWSPGCVLGTAGNVPLPRGGICLLCHLASLCAACLQ